MKRLILILTIAVLFLGSLFAQGERTKAYVQELIASETVSGKLIVTLLGDASYSLIADSCRNALYVNMDADPIKFTLPPCEEGLVVAFLDFGGDVITVDLYDGVDKIWLERADGGAGNEMESAGNVGDYVVLVGLDDTNWWALPIETLTWGIP